MSLSSEILIVMKLYFIILSFGVCLNCDSQTIPIFKLLRYDEDYSYLKNDTVKNYWYKKTKFLSLSKSKETYLSFGGEYRYQYFYFKNEGWGHEPKDNDGYLLSRFLGHADLHAGKFFRTFVQLQSSLANGKINSSPVDENQVDLHQLFADGVISISKQKSLITRIGRQELLYGSQRLVSTRDGPNSKQSFDAARIIYNSRQFRTDGFFSAYVISKRAIFDDEFNSNIKFWGGYAVINKIPFLKNIDLYYLGLWKRVARFDDGLTKENRHSIGTRIWGKSKNWEHDFETVYQWGKFGAGNISAWTVSSNTTYTFSALKSAPSINLKADLISGDKNYNDERLNTFNPLFPRGAYFGYAALIGPANLLDIHPSFNLDLLKTLRLTFDYDVFWRYSTHDGIYGPSGALLYSGKNIKSKYIGDQYSVFLLYAPSSFLYFRGEFTWFNSGDFLKEASPGKDIIFTGVTMQFKF